MTISVFLLDDHELVRRGLADLLEVEHDVTVVGEAGTAALALAQVPTLRPDVAVLDVPLPDGDGVRAIRTVAGGGSLLDPRAAAAVLERMRYVSSLLHKLGFARRGDEAGTFDPRAGAMGLWGERGDTAKLRQQDRHPGENHAEQHGSATGRRSGRRLGLRA
jgi:CheY-like chemotaxis protein